MHTDELHKFSDGMLNYVQTALHDITSRIRMEYLPKSKWSGLDKRRAHVMIKDIDNRHGPSDAMHNPPQPLKVVQIVLWYLDSGRSKHMIGDRSRLSNFVKKFIRTVRFRNDHFGAIMGYGDYVIGDSVISKVKFLRSKDEIPDLTVRYVRTDNGTKFVNKDLTDYYERVGIFHQKTFPRTPQQNGVVERQNRTLVEAARTMLIFSKAPMFLWAEAVAAACYT
ncbi:retrovirus-related pol polyprotein from transposon TNT 1-94 [Tanacetum coccineum]